MSAAQKTVASRKPSTRRSLRASPGSAAFATLSDGEAIEELYGKIEMYETSYAEADGVLRNASAKRTIMALARAIDCLRERDERRKASLPNESSSPTPEKP